MLGSTSPQSTEQPLVSEKVTMSRTQTFTATEETPRRTLLPAHDSAIYTIDELIRRRASELHDSPLIGYPKEGVTDYEDHSAFAVNRYADAAAEALQRRGLEKVVSTRNAQAELALTLCHRTPLLTRPLLLAFSPTLDYLSSSHC